MMHAPAASRTTTPAAPATPATGAIRPIGAIGMAGLSDQRWDVIVIGAGPAGSLTARELARRGRSVLLVEKFEFPRWKVCGACLNDAGAGALRQAGLGCVLPRIGARRIPAAKLLWRSRSAVVNLRGMVAVSRRALDAALARAAVEAGATLRTGVRAEIDRDGVVLHQRDRATPLRCRAVIQAGGLRASRCTSRSASRPGDDARIARRSWIGLGAVAPAVPTGEPDDGDLIMAVGRRGYVGRIVTEDGLANWAAAVDPAFVRACGGAGAAVEAICTEAGALHDPRHIPPRDGWRGTPHLTHRRLAQDDSLYRVGDASGYVEPITGEGMSWALLGAMRLAPIVDRALDTGTHGRAWLCEHARLLRWRRLRCAAVSRAMRSPVAMAGAMALLRLPGATPLFNRIIGGAAPRTRQT